MNMKDSGVKWIGSIPENWSVQRVKHAFVRKNEKAMQDNPVVLSLARSGVKIRDISNNEGQIAESYYNYNPVEEGDLLLNPMDLYSGANCSISKVNGVISPAYINLKNKEGYSSRFYDYYFKVQYWMMAFFAYGKGVSFDNRWSMSVETLMNYPIIALDYAEQCRRANYLDDKCSKIDVLVEKQQAIIDKLKKYKESFVTETVTSGLNISSEMKNSGIKEIGSIPSHWEMVKLKFLLSCIIDCPHETPNYVNSGEYLVIRTADQDYGVLRSDENMYRLDKDEYKNRIRRMSLDKDDIVYGREGERWGLACLVPENNKYCLGQRMMQFRCKKERILPEFAVWALNSKNVYLQGSYDTLGSTSPHVNISTIRNYAIPVPPIEEQEELVGVINGKMKKIDSIIERKEKLINNLNTYKKSLIYEVVTGKREV